MQATPINVDVESLLDHYGTATAPHAHGSLREHLIGTFELLKAWGNSLDVCLAGLFHSIYGTEVYTLQSAGLGEREVIRRVIGARAEELAYLFCACDRSEMLSNVNKSGSFSLQDRFTGERLPLEQDSLAALVELAFANDLEQLPDEVNLHTPDWSAWIERWTRCKPFLSAKAWEAFETRLNVPLPMV